MENVPRVEVNPIKMSKEDRIREGEILQNATPEELKAMFKHVKGGKKMSDMKMTEEEAKKIEECMDKPEFMGLFRDYVKDISDPANMEEYDQYIRQLEEEGEIPEDEEVVRPEKGFCIKTKTVDNGGKIFVNCCGTDRCPAPSQRPGTAPREEGSTGNPGTGAHWSLPYIYTSCRMDQDNKKEPCHVYDILFNTEALRLSEKEPRFKALVTQTALESLEEAGKIKLKDPNTGKFDFTILKNMTYKGSPVRPHRLKKDTTKIPEMKKDKKENLKPSTNGSKAKKPAPKAEPEDPTKPRVSIVHRGQYEMESSLLSCGNRDAPISSRPKELIVRIDLPLMKSAADMELETKGGFLELQVKDVYSLKQKLPFPVDDATGEAKYNKTLKQLTVTLQVLPWKPEEIEREIEVVKAEQQKWQEEQEKLSAEARKREEEEAKRVVKKGFLTGAGSGKGASTSEAGKGSKAPAIEDYQDVVIVERDGDVSCAVDAPEEKKKPLIEDLGECCIDRGSAATLEEVDGGTPVVNFRQNDQNVTMIVRVSNIEEKSVKADFTQTKVSLEFVATASANGKEVRTRYRHVLHPFADIDPLNCRHDVSAGNMVVILKKQACEKWATYTGVERDVPPPAPPAADAKSKDAGEEGKREKEKEQGGEGAEDGKHVRWADDVGDGAAAEASKNKSVPSTPPTQDASAVGGVDCKKEEENEEVQEGDDDFSPAKSYSGSREGFVFKMCSKGLGYYRDTYVAPAQTADDADGEGGASDEVLTAQKEQADKMMEAYKKAMPKLGFANNLMFELD